MYNYIFLRSFFIFIYILQSFKDNKIQMYNCTQLQYGLRHGGLFCLEQKKNMRIT